MAFTCPEGWKANPPAVVSEDQARQGLEILAYLKQAEADALVEHRKKLKKLETQLAEELMIDFSGEGGGVIPVSQYAATIEERLQAFALERMKIKTLKHGEHQLARRTNPLKVGLADEDQLDAIQAGLLPRMAELLESATAAEVISGVPQELAETPLKGLFKLRVELDIAAIKASLDNGSVVESELQQLGFEITKGEQRCDITIK